MSNDLACLRAKHPWPDVRPYATEEIINHDGGGRELICQKIASRPGCVMLEVGSFLGGSARRWLAASKDAVVICVDPWEGDWWIKHALDRGHNELAKRLAEPDGPINCFYTNMWPYRDRVIAFRGYAPEALFALHAEGLSPDIIYFDSDKTSSGIPEAQQLFPNAVISGDDWSWWGARLFQYPIRPFVRDAARRSGQRIIVRRATWLLQAEPLSPRQYWEKCLWALVDLVRPLRDWFKIKANL